MQNHFSDTASVFDYGTGNATQNNGYFGSKNSPSTIDSGSGNFTGNANYSIRAATYLQFDNAGTYTIAMGSDDGRRVELTDVGGSATFTGFTSVSGQGGGSGANVFGFSGGTGHRWTYGTFTVAAGDILRLDAFYYEGGGGDSGEIAIAANRNSRFPDQSCG